MEKFIPVKVPSDLISEVDKEVTNGNHGYQSRQEFVRDAVRQLLMKFKNGGAR